MLVNHHELLEGVKKELLKRIKMAHRARTVGSTDIRKCEKCGGLRFNVITTSVLNFRAMSNRKECYSCGKVYQTPETEKSVNTR